MISKPITETTTLKALRLMRERLRAMRQTVNPFVRNYLDTAIVVLNEASNSLENEQATLPQICPHCKDEGIDPDNGTDMNPEPPCERCQGNGEV
jgi:hypothetical protein